MQIQVDYANSDYANSGGLCKFRWIMQILMDYANSGGFCKIKWNMQIQVDYANSSGLCKFKWNQVDQATDTKWIRQNQVD